MATLWRDEGTGLVVWVKWRDGGALEIVGQHLGSPMPGVDEYEYGMVIAEDGLGHLAKALGLGLEAVTARTDDDHPIVVAMLARAEELIGVGERSWLERHGVPFEFWNWF